MDLAPADLLTLGSATLGEAGGRTLSSRLRPAWPGATLAGPAWTAACSPGDNLAVHVALATAPPGSVLVVDARAEPERGYWGEVLTTGAEARGVAGLVLDGGVRDVAALEAHRFPVFSERIALPGATKARTGSVGGRIAVGDKELSPGDWVVGDVDGVVVVDADRLEEVVTAAVDRAEREQDLFRRLREGATTVELLGLDPSRIKRPDLQ